MTRGVAPAALGLEVLVGRTGRENVATKAIRYLTEGRVMVKSVTPEGVLAHVRGGGEVYEVLTQVNGRWSCTCPAKSECCHILGVKTVVVAPEGVNEP